MNKIVNQPVEFYIQAIRLTDHFDIVYLTNQDVPNTPFKTNHFVKTLTVKTQEVEKEIEEFVTEVYGLIGAAIRYTVHTGQNYSPRNSNEIDWLKYTNKTFLTENPYEVYTSIHTDFAEDVVRGEAKVIKQTVLPPEKVGTIYFSPANRFSTVNTEAKELYVFSTDNGDGTVELQCETNFLVALEKPELIVNKYGE